MSNPTPGRHRADAPVLTVLARDTYRPLTLYIAGPMTGLPEFNYPSFFWAAGRLAQAGIDTINPARPEGREDCTDWIDFMRASLRDLADCDGIATLQGWADSRGAALEVHIARSLDLPIKPVGEWAEEYATTSPSTTKESSR